MKNYYIRDRERNIEYKLSAWHIITLNFIIMLSHVLYGVVILLLVLPLNFDWSTTIFLLCAGYLFAIGLELLALMRVIATTPIHLIFTILSIPILFKLWRDAFNTKDIHRIMITTSEIYYGVHGVKMARINFN